jgi:hypothetical protein
MCLSEEEKEIMSEEIFTEYGEKPSLWEVGCCQERCDAEFWFDYLKALWKNFTPQKLIYDEYKYACVHAQDMYKDAFDYYNPRIIADQNDPKIQENYS